jgi:hypothetical protein
MNQYRLKATVKELSKLRHIMRLKTVFPMVAVSVLTLVWKKHQNFAAASAELNELVTKATGKSVLGSNGSTQSKSTTSTKTSKANAADSKRLRSSDGNAAPAMPKTLKPSERLVELDVDPVDALAAHAAQRQRQKSHSDMDELDALLATGDNFFDDDKQPKSRPAKPKRSAAVNTRKAASDDRAQASQRKESERSSAVAHANARSDDDRAAAAFDDLDEDDSTEQLDDDTLEAMSAQRTTRDANADEASFDWDNYEVEIDEALRAANVELEAALQGNDNAHKPALAVSSSVSLSTAAMRPASARAASSGSGVERVRALFDYHTDKPGKLNFSKGDLITLDAGTKTLRGELADDGTDAWMRGSIGAQNGRFPRAYVRVSVL